MVRGGGNSKEVVMPSSDSLVVDEASSMDDESGVVVVELAMSTDCLDVKALVEEVIAKRKERERKGEYDLIKITNCNVEQ